MIWLILILKSALPSTYTIVSLLKESPGIRSNAEFRLQRDYDLDWVPRATRIQSTFRTAGGGDHDLQAEILAPIKTLVGILPNS